MRPKTVACPAVLDRSSPPPLRRSRRDGAPRADRPRRADRAGRHRGPRPRRCTSSRARRTDVARYVLILDAINFGSGWFGELDTTTDAITERLTAHARARRSLDRGRAARARRRRRRRARSAWSRATASRASTPQALNQLGAWLLGPPTSLLGDSADALAAAPHADAVLRRPRLLQARPDRRQRPAPRAASSTSRTSTGSRSSPTTSSRTSCAWTASCIYDDELAARRSTRRRELPAGERVRARAARLRRPRLRAARAPSRRPARARSTTGSGTAARHPPYSEQPAHITQTVFY